jgi:hypothetical protein
MKNLISRAVALLRKSPNLEDEAIYRALVADGMEREFAARLVEFLPLAYGRLVLGNSGILFSNAFDRALSDGRTSRQALSSEPLWDLVVDFARNEANHGVSGKDLISVAGRSAEFQAANELLQQRAKLENMAFMPPVLYWPERGPNP